MVLSAAHIFGITRSAAGGAFFYDLLDLGAKQSQSQSLGSEGVWYGAPCSEGNDATGAKVQSVFGSDWGLKQRLSSCAGHGLQGLCFRHVAEWPPPSDMPGAGCEIALGAATSQKVPTCRRCPASCRPGGRAEHLFPSMPGVGRTAPGGPLEPPNFNATRPQFALQVSPTKSLQAGSSVRRPQRGPFASEGAASLRWLPGTGGFAAVAPVAPDRASMHLAHAGAPAALPRSAATRTPFTSQHTTPPVLASARVAHARRSDEARDDPVGSLGSARPAGHAEGGDAAAQARSLELLVVTVGNRRPGRSNGEPHGVEVFVQRMGVWTQSLRVLVQSIDRR